MSQGRDTDVLSLRPNATTRLDARQPSDPDADVDDELLARTIEVWQPLSPKPLSREDARVIIENLTRYCNVLLEWSPRRRPYAQRDVELDEAA